MVGCVLIIVFGGEVKTVHSVEQKYGRLELFSERSTAETVY